jgi:hypothetical protein
VVVAYASPHWFLQTQKTTLKTPVARDTDQDPRIRNPGVPDPSPHQGQQADENVENLFIKYAVFRIRGPSGSASGSVIICTAPDPYSSINKQKTEEKP